MASRDGFKQIIKQNTPKENASSLQWSSEDMERYSQVRKYGKSSTRHKVEISPASEREAVGDCLTGLGKAFRLDTLRYWEPL